VLFNFVVEMPSRNASDFSYVILSLIRPNLKCFKNKSLFRKRNKDDLFLISLLWFSSGFTDRFQKTLNFSCFRRHSASFGHLLLITLLDAYLVALHDLGNPILAHALTHLTQITENAERAIGVAARPRLADQSHQPVIVSGAL
jgi:hypothetical protein